ncbi:tetratricopeptide repeat protein, partial [bacterium]|nr:tetratricopeptide repeat protein [bacterium]MBU1959368.1 tetratricopeptide repeat protein [bacterium]
MIDRYQKDDFFISLDKNDRVQKLIKSIYYSFGHNVDMVTTSSSITLNLLLEYIDIVLRREAEPKEIVILSIAKGLEVFFEELISHYGKEGEYLYVFDFTSLEEDQAEYTFMMINKERNLILERLNSPILLVMPKSLKRVFAYSAADFWSVKKYSVDVEFYRENEEQRVSLDEAKFDDMENGELAGLLKEEQRLTQQIKEKNESFFTERLYLINQIEIGDYHKIYGALDKAFISYEKALLMAYKLQNRRPDSIEAKRDLSVSLEKLADIYLQKGDVEKALKHYQEGLELA